MQAVPPLHPTVLSLLLHILLQPPTRAILLQHHSPPHPLSLPRVLRLHPFLLQDTPHYPLKLTRRLLLSHPRRLVHRPPLSPIQHPLLILPPGSPHCRQPRCQPLGPIRHCPLFLRQSIQHGHLLKRIQQRMALKQHYHRPLQVPQVRQKLPPQPIHRQQGPRRQNPRLQAPIQPPALCRQYLPAGHLHQTLHLCLLSPSLLRRL